MQLKHYSSPMSEHHIYGLLFMMAELFYVQLLKERARRPRRSVLKSTISGALLVPFSPALSLRKAQANLNSITEKPQTSEDSSEIDFIAKLNSEYLDQYGHNTFENFMVGECNTFAYEAARNCSVITVQSQNPLYIYGKTGLGKTHLLHAITNKIFSENCNKKIILTSSEIFMSTFLNSMVEGTTRIFKGQIRSVDAILIDDVQFFGGKSGTQVELIHILNAFYSEKKQIILTSDTTPLEIESLDEKLCSRFSQGLVVDISLPDIETKISILKQKSQVENVCLHENAAYYLAIKAKNSIRELEGEFNRCLFLARLKNIPISIDLVSS